MTSTALAVSEGVSGYEVLRELVTARKTIAAANIDSLITARAWCEAVAATAKQRALREVALEAGETRLRVEIQLGRLLAGGAGAHLNISTRAALIELAHLDDDQVEAVIADLRKRRRGDQILQFLPHTVLARAATLFRSEVAPGIFLDYRGRYNGYASLEEARRQALREELEDEEWEKLRLKWQEKRERRKPKHVRLDDAFARARRLSLAVAEMREREFGGDDAYPHLARAELLLMDAADSLHLALKNAVLREEGRA